MSQIIGKVGMTPRGMYDRTRAYERLDVVTYQGSSWVAIVDVPAQISPAMGSDYWQLQARMGETGPQGPVGPQGNSAFDGTGVELVNNLTQGGQTAALSAEQGKILKQELTELESNIGLQVSSFAVKAGGFHSSTIDRLNTRIKKGEYFAVIGKSDDAKIENFTITAVYSTTNVYQELGSYPLDSVVIIQAQEDILSVGFTVNSITQSGVLNIEVQSSLEFGKYNHAIHFVPDEQGALSNIDTKNGTITIVGCLVCGNAYYFVNNTFPIKNGVALSGALKVAYDVTSKTFRTIPYSEGVKESEIILGGIRVNYGETFSKLVAADFPFRYTIDGKSSDVALQNSVTKLLSDYARLSKGSAISYVPNEDGALPNIDTTKGEISMKGWLIIEGSVHFVNTIVLPIKNGTNLSSAQKIVINTANSSMRIMDYSAQSAINEIVVGCLRVNYGETFTTLVQAYFPFEFTIDGKKEWEKEEVRGFDVPSGIFEVQAGVGHSSVNDRVKCSITKGDDFLVLAEAIDGAAISHAAVNVQYDDSSPWEQIGDIRIGIPTKFTAKANIISIGIYLDASFVTSKGKLRFTIFNNTFYKIAQSLVPLPVSSNIPDFYSYEKLMDIQGQQGGCCYDDIFLAGYLASSGAAIIKVYNLENKTYIQDISISGMSVSDSHQNSMCFGDFYAEEDVLPLLYVSSGYSIGGGVNGTSEVYVYRLKGALGSLEAELIQTIKLEDMGWTEAMVDIEHSALWIKCKTSEYRCYELPSLENSEITYSYDDAPLDSFVLPDMKFPYSVKDSSGQCHQYYRGKIWAISGIPASQGDESCFMQVVNVRSKCREAVIWLQDVGLTNEESNIYEPESLFFWKGKLCIGYTSFIAQIKKEPTTL